MNPSFPGAVPEIPVSDLNAAADYYEKILGFTIDWGRGHGNIMGISKGNCRLFLTDDSFRAQYRNRAPIMIWLNLDSIEQVNELFAIWSDNEAKIISPPESKSWGLHEFTIADPDGNGFRVFYDFSTPDQNDHSE